MDIRLGTRVTGSEVKDGAVEVSYSDDEGDKSITVRVDRMCEANSEFPTFNPSVSGRPHEACYTACSIDNGANWTSVASWAKV